MPPPLAPDGSPLQPEMMMPIFPMELILQEVSQERWIAIPDPVREVYALWRPTPLHRAVGFERALGTDCKIFYKYEGVSPAGSHKPNTSVPQAYYNAQAGIRRLATETGAGQWGSSLALACQLFGLECKVYMVRVSYDSKPYRRVMIETWGGECVASPSSETNAGRTILAEHPDSTGSLGIAISEAVEDAATREDTNYALGSVLNHVLLHQTVVGPGGHRADADGRCAARRRRGLRWRRLQLRGSGVSVSCPEVRRRGHQGRRRRAGVVSEPDARGLRLRLRRHRRA